MRFLLKLGVQSRAQAIALALQQEPLLTAPAVVDMIAMDAGGGRREVVN